MRRILSCAMGACVALVMGGWVSGQDVFTLGFEGADSLKGAEGSVVSGVYGCSLNQEGTGPGAQGWSISVLVEGAETTSFTTAGTAADKVANGGYWDGGFNKTQVIDPAKNEGKKGAVSAVVLSFTSGATLPALTKQVIGTLGIDATIPVGGGSARLSYTNGLIGAGQPVDNAVTQDGNTVQPVKGEKIIDLPPPPPSCCGKDLNVGFSGALIRGGTDPSAVAGELELCSGGGGSIVTEVALGATGAKHIFANVISNLPADDPATPAPNLDGAQGWSFSIAVNGDVNILGATTAGTAADKVDNGGYWDGGFNKTQVIDPAKNAGQRGAVSAVVLSFTSGATLPPIGTESVLDVSLEANAAQGETDIVGEAKFLTGLVGAGQPVQNALTVAGNTETACNFPTASVAVVFKKIEITDRFYLPGNMNNDLKMDIADPIYIINYLLREGPALVCEAAGDANQDGFLDASDALYIALYLFASGPIPVGMTGDGCIPAPSALCQSDQLICLP